MIRVYTMVVAAILCACEAPHPMTQQEYQRNVAISHMFEIAHDSAPHMLSTYGCYPNALGGQNCMISP